MLCFGFCICNRSNKVGLLKWDNANAINCVNPTNMLFWLLTFDRYEFIFYSLRCVFIFLAKCLKYLGTEASL